MPWDGARGPKDGGICLLWTHVFFCFVLFSQVHSALNIKYKWGAVKRSVFDQYEIRIFRLRNASVQSHQGPLRFLDKFLISNVRLSFRTNVCQCITAITLT